MYRQNVSGQPLFLAMLSAISGNPVTGIAAAISGRKSIDGGAQALLSGTISELGGGQYVANLYDFDINGKVVGFYFTASGCVPVSYTVTTDGNVSGRLSLVSGHQVNVYSGQLSGYEVNAPAATINSGTLFLASGHFLFGSGQFFLNSGQNVRVYSGQLSGHAVNLLSGNQTAAVSGTTFLASGSQVNLLSGNTVALYSGQNVNLFSGNQVAVVSGTRVNAFSGQVYPNSGLATNLLSGAAGNDAFASGILDHRIPRAVLVWDFTAGSGVIASGMSGRCLLNASRKLTNKFSLAASSGYLTAYMEDDTSVAFRQSLTSVSGAAPLTGLDTV